MLVSKTACEKRTEKKGRDRKKQNKKGTERELSGVAKPCFRGKEEITVVEQ